MNAMHGDGVAPDGTPPAGAGVMPIRILITLTPEDRVTELLEIQHSRNVQASQIAEVLSTVAEILRADGPGVVISSGVIFGGIRRE